MKWLTILFGIFIVLVIVLADTGHLGFLAIIYEIPRADKVAHFLLYGVLAFLVNLTLMRSYPDHNPRRIALFSGLVLALLIGPEEFSQRLFANRTFSMVDVTASYLGVCFFSWIAVISRRAEAENVTNRGILSIIQRYNGAIGWQ